MKYRTAQKTGRTAAMQLRACPRSAFSDYAAMVERMSGGYVRPLRTRVPRASIR